MLNNTVKTGGSRKEKHRMNKPRCLNCSTKFKPKRSDQKFCETKCRVYYNRNIRNGKVTDNSGKIILSLCDYSGVWSRPYREAGYNVVQVDLKLDDDDVRLFKYPGKVYGVLAAPPCTDFAVSGAVHWSKKGEKALLAGLGVFDACSRIVLFAKPEFWVFENPVGRLKHYIGEARWIFDPCDYGHNYTKRTCLWGEFNIPKPENEVEPICVPNSHHSIDQYWVRQVEKISRDRQTLRSITPEGFARAFFKVNR